MTASICLKIDLHQYYSTVNACYGDLGGIIREVHVYLDADSLSDAKAKNNNSLRADRNINFIRNSKDFSKSLVTDNRHPHSDHSHPVFSAPPTFLRLLNTSKDVMDG